MKYLSFDIETAKITPENTELFDHRPLGITCYAVAWMSAKSGMQTKFGHGIKPDGSPAPKMSQQECATLVRNLVSATTEKGYVLLAHNGAGFDLDILAEESGLYRECVQLAIHSVDTMLHIHCVKGYPVGLDAIARGMKLLGKPEGMNGSLAPKMWANGQYDEVLKYVEQDVRVALEVTLAVERRGGMTWVAKSGKLNSLPIKRWLTVKEALRVPEPDTSWMDSPLPRSKFVRWMEAQRMAMID